MFFFQLYQSCLHGNMVLSDNLIFDSWLRSSDLTLRVEKCILMKIWICKVQEDHTIFSALRVIYYGFIFKVYGQIKPMREIIG